jgi:hypothetical protein
MLPRTTFQRVSKPRHQLPPWVLPLFVFNIAVISNALAASDNLDLTPVPEADEQLYLVTTLRYAYDSLPHGSMEGAKSAAQLQQLRYSAVRYREYIKEKGLDPKLASLYDDLVSTIDSHRQFLVRAKAIRDDAQAKQADADRKLVGGLLMLATTGNGIGLGGALNAVNSLSASGQTSRAATQAVAGDELEVEKRVSDATARAESICLVLSEKYKWKHGETGFSTREQESQEFKGFVARNDGPGAIQWCEKLAEKRSRDPGATLLLGYCRVAMAGTDPNSMYESAKECTRAIRLVPAGELYDQDRGGLAYAVAGIAAQAAMRESGASGSDAAGARTKARYALHLFDAAANWLPPSAVGNQGNLQQAWAGALAIDGKLPEALHRMAQIQSIMKEDPGYAYNMACLGSQAGQADTALQWLRQSMLLGYSNIAHARRDPDLESLRKSRSAQFEQLATVHYSWKVVPTMFSGDAITLTNESAFTLTNVTLTPRIEVGRTPVPVAPLKIISLAPGKTCRWEKALKLPGHRFDRSAAELACDQKP